MKILAGSQHMHRTELNCERLTDDDPVHCHLHAVLSARGDIVVPRTDTKTFCRLRTSPHEQASDLYDLSATLNCATVELSLNCFRRELKTLCLHRAFLRDKVRS